MTFATISTAYLSSALLPAVRQAQAQLATLETESATGQYADLGQQLGSQTGYEISLRNQDDLLQALTAANSITSTNMSTAQAAMTSLLNSAQSTAQNLTQMLNGSASPQSLETIGTSNLQELTALANTSASGGYVFAGENLAQAPLDDFFAQPSSAPKSALDNAFQSFFGFSTTSPQVANITSSQMQSFLSGPFAAEFSSPAWGSNWSTSSDNNITSQISPGNTIATSITTNSSAFQQLAQSYSMLTEFGAIGLNPSALQTLTSSAVDSVNQGIASLIAAQTTLGQAQSSVTSANASMATQSTLIQKQLSQMDSVDPAQIATQLTTLTTQLQTAYQLTSQLHNLTLAQYLPA